VLSGEEGARACGEDWTGGNQKCFGLLECFVVAGQ
jgi:hypothetical protein